MNLLNLDNSGNWNQTIFALFWMAYFILPNVFQVNLCCSIYQSLIPFMAEEHSVPLYIWHLFTHSSSDGHLGFFHLLVIVFNWLLSTEWHFKGEIMYPDTLCYQQHMHYVSLAVNALKTGIPWQVSQWSASVKIGWNELHIYKTGAETLTPSLI